MNLDHLKEFAAHYWYVGLAVSFAWTVLSIVWTVRVERALARLRAAVRYLQADDSCPAAHESTPTVSIRTGRPIPPPPAAPENVKRYLDRIERAYGDEM